MAKNFTAEDIKKKHETNIKAAVSSYGLVGLLGIAYVVRYFIKGDFNFYFSLSFTELMLRLGDSGTISSLLSYGSVAVFAAVYIVVLIIMNKDAAKLKAGLWVYVFDSICLIPLGITGGIQPEFFIDVTVHLFVIVFIVVGCRSYRATMGEKN